MSLGRVKCSLGRRKLEDQPSASHVHRREPQHIPEKRSVTLGVIGIEQKMRAIDHVLPSYCARDYSKLRVSRLERFAEVEKMPGQGYNQRQNKNSPEEQHQPE
jgi:hypothetical protein